MRIWVSDEFEGTLWIEMWMKSNPRNRYRWVNVEPAKGAVEATALPGLNPWVEQAKASNVKILLTPEEVERYIKWD